MILNPFTVVGTTDSNTGTRMPHMTNSCYANGRFWVFYSAYGKRKAVSTDDGINWVTIDVRNTGSIGADFAIVIDDEGNIHYIYAYGYLWGGESPKYRKGFLNNDGSISWYAPEQELSNFNEFNDPHIVLDSDGYPWVSLYSSDTSSPKVQSKVYKSSTKDGTWVTAPGFPYDPSVGLAYTEYLIILCPMNDNKMMIVYSTQDTGGSTTSLYSRLYDGSSWGSQKTVAKNVLRDWWGKIIARAIGDEVIVSWYGKDIPNCGGTGKGIFWNKWTGTDWLYPADTPPVDYVLVCNTPYSNPILTKTADNKMLLFWMADYRVWYKEYFNGVWSDAIEWFYDPNYYLDNHGYSVMSCFDRMNGIAGCFYRSGLPPIYNIMAGYMYKDFCEYIIDNWNNEKPWITLETVFEVIDSYIYENPLPDYIIIPSIVEVIGTIDYHLGFNGDEATGCNIIS